MAKNIYIGVDNVARKVKQPYIGVDNISRKVKSGFIGVDNVARQFFSGGTPISNLAVGTIVKLNENGVAKDYIIVNQGKPDGDIYDSSFNNGTWLMKKDSIEPVQYASSQYAGYKESKLRSWLNSTMLGRFDASIQSIIKTVNVPYQELYNSNVKYGSNGLKDKIFIATIKELGYVGSGTSYAFGTKLAYFDSWDSTVDSKIFGYYDGVLASHVVRSWGYNAYMLVILSPPPYATINTGDANSNRQCRPMLIFPFETIVDSNMNIIAS